MKIFTIVAIVFIAILAMVSFSPFQITGYAPDNISLPDTLSSPSPLHLFGSDNVGRDVFARVIYGARASFLIAFGAQIISFAIGISVGVLSGYYNNHWVDRVFSFIMASFHGFPFLLFVIAITAALGPGIYKIMIAIGIVNWVGIAGVTRSEVTSHSEKEYVITAKSFGYSNFTILFWHILPNVITSSLIVLIQGFGDVVAVEAGLSFLGLGVPPPTASWGKMIFTGKDYITTAWWMSVFPGIFLVMTILSFNIIGEELMKRWTRRK